MRADNGERFARVVSVGRNAAWIAFEDAGPDGGDEGVRLAALRKNVDRTMLVPGDLVRVVPLDAERVVIERREPRSFTLERTSLAGRSKTMAANVDGIAVVAAFARPALHFAMIDELLAFAEIHGIEARLIFTKADLAESESEVAAVLALYRDIGYTALVANPKVGQGVEAIRAALAGHRTLLIGHSGVGKSSLFAALGGPADVGAVSKSGVGKGTTTTGRLHRFPAALRQAQGDNRQAQGDNQNKPQPVTLSLSKGQGDNRQAQGDNRQAQGDSGQGQGFLIDSPGVGEFEVRGCTPAELALGFVEFAPLVGSCRFGDCTHRSEPGCRVREAVETGTIAASRYASYLAMLARDPSTGSG